MSEDVVELPPATLAAIPFVVETNTQLQSAIDSLSAGTGPFGVDAERASGFRYSSRAYLIQISRRGGGTHLIDPIACNDLSDLGALLRTDEWILHAATQDLACLAEVGLTPTSLFDTELGSRLAGLPRVGLATVVAELLGLHLAKEHSAADWSTRPLPQEWLVYAALDVELLPDLRDALDERLVALGKDQIARQEFDNLVTWKPAPARQDPWRRLSQIQTLTTPRQLAIARELWIERDAIAQELDMGPGRIIPDGSIVAAAKVSPTSKGQLAGLSTFTGRLSRKQLERWWSAIERGHASDDLPPMRAKSGGLSAPRNWKERHPDAYARFVASRGAVLDVAEQVGVPVENLLTPDTLRRLCWEPPTDTSAVGIAGALHNAGARKWQIDATSERIADSFIRAADHPEEFLSASTSAGNESE
ncbi:MAG: hypothetical protein RLZ72_1228 [Actinomycetota bacterium]